MSPALAGGFLTTAPAGKRSSGLLIFPSLVEGGAWVSVSESPCFEGDVLREKGDRKGCSPPSCDHRSEMSP